MTADKKYQAYIVWGLFFALSGYLVMRSVWLPIQHDEAATFYYYIQTGNFLPPNAHWDANNHILNSFLSHISYKLFGNEVWILRLPNLLSFALFFWSSWKISALLKKPLIRWGLFLSLVMAHYLFEFFGQTRGYGLSMALLLTAIWVLLQFLKNRSTFILFSIIFILFLATAANLTLLTSSFLMIAYALIIPFSQDGFSSKTIRLTFGSLLLSILLFAPLVWFSFALKKGGALYYGGMSGFWDYTGSSLSLYFTGYYNFLLSIIYSVLFYVLVLTSIFILLKIKNLKTIVSEYPSFIFIWLLTGSVASVFTLRYLLNVNFPEDRTAVYLYPFLVGAIAFLINDLHKISNKNLSLLAIPLFYFPLHFLFKINTSTTIFPMAENPPREFFDIVSNQKPLHGHGYPLTIGGYHMQRLCWSYMNHQNGGHQGEMLVSNHIDTLCDFQIIDITRVLPNNFEHLYAPLNDKPKNNLNLYQRKKQLTYHPVHRIDSITNWNHSQDEYFDLFVYNIPDSLKEKPFFVGVNATIDVHNYPFVASVVISQQNAAGKELSQENIHLDWMKKKWDNQINNLKHGIIIPPVHPDSKQLLVYLWNQKNNSFLIRNGKVELFVLE